MSVNNLVLKGFLTGYKDTWGITWCYYAVKKDDKENLEIYCDGLCSSPCNELPPFPMRANL